MFESLFEYDRTFELFRMIVEGSAEKSVETHETRADVLDSNDAVLIFEDFRCGAGERGVKELGFIFVELKLMKELESGGSNASVGTLRETCFDPFGEFELETGINFPSRSSYTWDLPLTVKVTTL